MAAKIGGLWSLGLAGMIAASAGRADASGSRAIRPPSSPEIKTHAISEEKRLIAEAQLDSCVAKVEKTVSRQGEDVVAARMGRELGMEPAALIRQQAELECFLGDLLIAHSLLANAQTTLNARQIVALHDGGMGWADIALGLGLRLHHVVRALINETRVAAGLSRGDGKVATMHVDSVSTLEPPPVLATREGHASPAGNVARAGVQKPN